MASSSRSQRASRASSRSPLSSTAVFVRERRNPFSGARVEGRERPRVLDLVDLAVAVAVGALEALREAAHGAGLEAAHVAVVVAIRLLEGRQGTARRPRARRSQRAQQRRGHENRRVGSADVRQKESSPLALARFLHLGAFRKPTSDAINEQGAYQLRKEAWEQRVSAKTARSTRAPASPVRDRSSSL